MNFFVLGLNHQTAPLAIREQFAFAEKNLSERLKEFQVMANAKEIIFLSTCNRSEFYCVDGDPQQLIQKMSAHVGFDLDALQAVLYLHHNEAALRHLARVSSGLDSMILGEPQILGQVKSAYEIASEAGTVAKQLHQIFQHNFFLSKKIRTETAIGKNPVSVAFAAVRLAKHLFSKLDQSKILMLGAGETIELTARHFFEQGARQFIFANRTLARAENLANQYHADAITLDELAVVLPEVDIIVAATDSTKALVKFSLLEKTREKNKSKALLIIDLAVPRNVDSDVANWPDVYLYTIDDLQAIVLDNADQRQAAAQIAAEMIDHEVQLFLGKLLIAPRAEVIQSFMSETDKALAEFFADEAIQGLSAAEQEAVKKLVRRLQHEALLAFKK